MITFYQLEWCPSCHTIRQLLTELGLTYTTVNVAADPDARPDVVAISGKRGVPVLQDGDRVLGDTGEILDYLRATYPAAEDAPAHARRGAWRMSHKVSLPPRAALARLKELLADNGFEIVTQVKGPKIAEALPDEYVLLHVAIPAAAAKAFESDPLAPSALLLPIAVVPVEGGSSVVASADPVGQVWLYSEPALRTVLAPVKKRLTELLAAL